MDIAAGQIGSETKYAFAFTAQHLKASVDYAGKQLSGGMYMAFDAEQVIEALFAALPKGTVEDEVKMVMLAGLKMIPA